MGLPVSLYLGIKYDFDFSCVIVFSVLQNFSECFPVILGVSTDEFS